MKKLLLLSTLIAYMNNAAACGVCACSASNQYLGILPNSKSSFVGMQYQLREFKSSHDAMEGMQPETSRDFYHTAQLWGRYNPFGNVQLFAFVPYVYNERYEDAGYSRTTGLGDVTVLANYRILGANCTGKEWQHHLLAGGGIKLPTGKYDRQAITYNEGLPNIQPGTASYDFIVNTNYTLQHNNTGVNADVSYVITTPNRDKYKFGNRLSAGLLAFHNISARQLKLIPQAGARFEHAETDYSNYYYSIKNTYSGGNQLFASVGLQAFRNNIGAQAMFHIPLAQHYVGDMVTGKYKTELGIYFLF